MYSSVGPSSCLCVSFVLCHVRELELSAAALCCIPLYACGYNFLPLPCLLGGTPELLPMTCMCGGMPASLFGPTTPACHAGVVSLPSLRFMACRLPCLGPGQLPVLWRGDYVLLRFSTLPTAFCTTVTGFLLFASTCCGHTACCHLHMACVLL